MPRITLVLGDWNAWTRLPEPSEGLIFQSCGTSKRVTRTFPLGRIARFSKFPVAEQVVEYSVLGSGFAASLSRPLFSLLFSLEHLSYTFNVETLKGQHGAGFGIHFGNTVLRYGVDDEVYPGHESGMHAHSCEILDYLCE
jgi:hypothetical protein